MNERAPDQRHPAVWRLGSLIGRLPPLLVDGVLAVVVAITITITIAAAREVPSRRPDALAYGLGLLVAALVLLRRRWPLGVLVASFVVLFVYYSLDYPGFVPAVPIAVALYTAAAAGGVAWAIGASLMWTVFPIVYRLFEGSEPVARILSDALRDGATFMAIVLLGVVVRARRAYATEVAERLRRAQEESERITQELRVARLVQEQFLPAELPDISGWKVSAFYRSAREVGGDFYSFIDLPTGEIGVAIGDVTDKGAPAALIMATAQGLLRAEGPRTASPSAVLEKMNEVLVHNTPQKMFATCLYIALDATTGRLRFANAGHNLPYLAAGSGGVAELRATGVPLGLLPGTTYEMVEAVVPPGARLLLHSDGLAEAHDRDRGMFGFPRVMKVMEYVGRDDDLIPALLADLDRFTGPGWEQEDDITLVTLERAPA